MNGLTQTTLQNFRCKWVFWGKINDGCYMSFGAICILFEDCLSFMVDEGVDAVNCNALLWCWWIFWRSLQVFVILSEAECEVSVSMVSWWICQC